MHHISVAFPLWLQISAAVVLALLLGRMLREMTWNEIFVPGRIQHFVIAALLMLLIWSLRAQSVDGLAMHFLGVAVVTLVFGWQLAVLMVSLVVVMLAVLGIVDPLQVPLTILLSGALPALAVWGLLGFSERRLPPHMFIYLYVVGFFGGVLSVLVVMGSYAALFGLFTDVPWELVYSEYLRYTVLLILPEGVLNGMVITGLVMFRPEWVATYSDARYVDGR
ncbi:energy-coupling factor ABC transporter permease [Thioalkalivibrio paradoxus]|uniref:Membrane protein n=1 Tax=Thioalkalivibrio paradoxus ARh 1 TaxID=713585 RepID=W0DRN4_9GAMM|nr:energy-coupling factor ABC transporter permease [Thioalkalivibrio paradoxus]AHE99520.1 membrane protein [Thioalkalivibrio paradoxus ARh 1]